MLRKGFNEDVRNVLEKHDVKDEKLELVLTDLFNEFERRILSRDFIKKISGVQGEEIYRAGRARGIDLRRR